MTVQIVEDAGSGAFLSLYVLCVPFHSKRAAQLKCLGKINLAEEDRNV